MAAPLLVLAGAGAGAAQAVPPPQGWQPFTLSKPAEERRSAEERPKLPDVVRQHLKLPPRHDLMRTTVGVGYIVGHDWGLELGAAGRIAGLRTTLNAFVTAGSAGLQMPAGRFLVEAPQGAWRAEAGDLVSELRGLARGARVAFGNRRGHRPMLNLYLPSLRLDDRTTTVSYRDEVRLFSRVLAGGEIASDGAHFAQAAYLAPRFDVHASYRRIGGETPSRHAGLIASMKLAKGIIVQAGLSGFETPADRDRSRLLAARFPLGTLAAITIEDIRSTHPGSADASNAVSVQLLRGPVQLTQRFQWGSVRYIRVGDVLSLQQRQLQTAASVKPAKWASLNPQTVTQWLADGRAQQWQELQADFTLSRSARLQLSGSIPGIFDRSRFRTRFTQELGRQLALTVEYGRVSPYQNVLTSFDREPRFGVALRKAFKAPLPAYGATVRGTVKDQLGNPVAGVPIRLGTFLTVTGDDGRYLFARVPSGDFELKIAAEWLPAQYAWDGTPQQLSVAGRGVRKVDFTLTPLDSIRGRVYLDKNGNGRFDAGEERAGVVVTLGAAVTATVRDGTYGFYNLPPGEYVVRVDADRLRGDSLRPAGRDAVTVVLEAGKAIGGIDFPLLRDERPVMFQRLTTRP